jgi:uncharacterized protein
MLTIEDAQKWYNPHDPVHGFDHVIRVVHLAEEIGLELKADLEILRAAALLHDAYGADPTEGEGRTTHEQDSASFAAEVLQDLGWDESRIVSVQHCIKAHRYRGNETPGTLEAKILFDADKLDVVGAFGIARTIGYAVQAQQPIFVEPSKQFLQSGEKEVDEPHSAYHEYLFKLRKVINRLHTEQAKVRAQNRFRLMNNFFEQLAAEARGED